MNRKMGKRKYPKVSGYWVYSIQVKSNGKYYIGVSKVQCSQRWIKSKYESSSLNQYLDEWQDMEKTVLIDGLSREESLKLEDELIQSLSMSNLCINSQRSGLITNDINAYAKELLKNNSEYRERQKQYSSQYHKQRYENDVEYREKVNQRNKQYREDNKEKIRECQKEWYKRKKLEKQQHTSLQQ